MNLRKMETRVFIEDRGDYYSCEGCCLVCSKQAAGCLCFECKCRKCIWYEEKDVGGGHCSYHSDPEEKGSHN